MRISKCVGRAGIPGCGAEIIWTTSRLGKKMPIDAKPDPTGNFIIEMDGDEPFSIFIGTMVVKGLRYTSHFATCPNAYDFRQVREGERR